MSNKIRNEIGKAVLFHRVGGDRAAKLTDHPDKSTGTSQQMMPFCSNTRNARSDKRSPNSLT